MKLAAMLFATVFCCAPISAQEQQGPQRQPHFDYETARAHELKPHRRNIPIEGAQTGVNQLHLRLIVSIDGDVISSEADSGSGAMKFWPKVENEVRQWKFKPFQEHGVAVSAEVEEYVDLVPPERLPKRHVKPPALTPESAVSVTLHRSGCYGACPAYAVTVSTDSIVFEGRGYVAAAGKYTDKVAPETVRKLAARFIAADFYSMDDQYHAAVTDCPTYSLEITIDGHSMRVGDYMGHWVGMPAVITELEDAVDEVSNSARWIEGSSGLISNLKTNKYDFKSFQAQVLLKEAATRGQADTVRDLLAAGVPLTPIPAPKPAEPWMGIPFEHVGWLNAAATHYDVLRILIDSGASRNDGHDKTLALASAARAGNIEAVRALIAYGADPSADLGQLTETHQGAGMTMSGPGEGSVLFYAAASGKPELLREILSYHPDVNARGRDGKTALFYAVDYEGDAEGEERAECVRLLVGAGAHVNARDKEGNTPLHHTFLGPVEEELLRLGADVNARNEDGETPIFTTVDDNAVALFIKHGADLTIRNHEGKTVFEAAERRGPLRIEALRKAVATLPGEH